ncbi:MAG: Flp family type IVb pilin [Nevskiales bacterium]|nr:Flp family type IVb pilin [Nevskiales bacterium]
MISMVKTWIEFLRNEEGASAVEYGLIIGLIAVALIIILTTLGTDLGGLFTKVSGEVTKAAGTGGT